MDTEPIVRSGLEYTDPDLYAALVEDCEAFWATRPPHYTRYEQEGDKEAFIAREVAFVERVYDATVELAETHEGPITLLLDVDETFARNEYGGKDGSEITTYVRPGLATLFKKLDNKLGDRYDVGLLTSRGHSHLEDELETDAHGYMGHVRERLNLNFVISSRDGSPIYEAETLQEAPDGLSYGYYELALEAIKSIVRPEVAEAALAEQNRFKKTDDETDYEDIISSLVPRGHWYDPKLAILAYLAEQHPDRAFVFVDDLPFPVAVDNTHPQVRGVSLYDGATFQIR